MVKIIVLKTDGPEAPQPERERKPAEKTIAGPVDTTTWNQWSGEDDRLHSGIWESSVGKWTVEYDVWEFCHFIAGKAVLTSETGESWTIGAGEAFVIQPGFKGTWETVEPIRKHYVILTPAA